jgi:ATP phosphoribosyltransferase regulatory subunit
LPARGLENPAFLAHPLPAGMRDLLPAEAESQGRLLARLLGTFDLFGFQRVSLPVFEYADVLERGLGSIEATNLLRFVEPESGEIVALRPDVTPQVARLVSTRLSAHPGPMRLCYRGSVVRRQRERARHDQQILQAGIELIGASGLASDLEVIEVTATALRQAGLSTFTVDLGHGAIAQSLLTDVSAALRAELLDALSLKDGVELARRAARGGVSARNQQALLALVRLQGGLEVFALARESLAETAAWPHVVELEALARAIDAAGLAPALVVDIGETRTVQYYTGPMFQVLAEGPGQAVASGGRYDALYARFGQPRCAAGAAIHVDHLRWALGNQVGLLRNRVLVVGGVGADDAARSLLAALRQAGVPAALAAPDGGSELPLDYARAWGYSLLARPLGSGENVACDLFAPNGDSISSQLTVTAAVEAARSPRG